MRTRALRRLASSPGGAARLREYQAVGVDTIIASGYPHLEEAYKVAELLSRRSGSNPAMPSRDS